MDFVSPSSSLSAPPRETSNYDEVLMQQSLIFSHSLEELKNLRKQLYSAAEYFEHTDCKDDNSHIVMDTLKDYAIKSLVNTIDHLGSMASKVEGLIDKKAIDFHRSALQFSCIEQRIRSWQEFNNQQGISRQWLVIKPPKHHRRYILPEAMLDVNQKVSPYNHGDQNQSRNAIRTTTRGNPSSVRQMHSAAPFSQPYNPRMFSFVRLASTKELEKQGIPKLYPPLMHSGSLISGLPSQNSSTTKKRTPSAPRTYSLAGCDAREMKKELEEYSSKSKRLFRALLSTSRSRKIIQN